MGKIPDEILRHRLPGTEIKQVGGRYYIQRVKCVWVPEKKKRRKVVLEFIGSVTAEGITPKKARKIPAGIAAACYSLEYGASWAAREVSGDIRDCLARHFGTRAEGMYVVALLRCILPSAMRYIEHRYETSFLSVVLPGLDLRSESLGVQMKALGRDRAGMEAFMREFVPSGDWFAIFDGTSLVCHSRHIREAQRGYNPRGGNDPQVNLLCAIALKDDGIAPVFYKRYPGSIRDVSAFRNLATAMGLTTALVIADKGFTKKAECERLERDGLSCILPLRRNSREYSRAPLQKPGRTGFDGRFRYHGRIVWYAEVSNAPGSAHRCLLYLDENLCHAETLSRMSDKIGKETPGDLRKAAEKQLEFGAFVLKTNLRNHSPESIYRAYKTRDDMEQLFDPYKCEEQFATTGMHGAETREACLFLNHLSLMIACRFYDRLKKNNKLKEFAVQKTLEHLLKDIRVSRFANDSWQLEPVPKAARLALGAIGNPPDTPG
jgi:hypothetical protein